MCHHCVHRGRYLLDPKPGLKSIQALHDLARLIRDDDEVARKEIDWDKINWDRPR